MVFDRYEIPRGLLNTEDGCFLTVDDIDKEITWDEVRTSEIYKMCYDKYFDLLHKRMLASVIRKYIYVDKDRREIRMRQGFYNKFMDFECIDIFEEFNKTVEIKYIKYIIDKDYLLNIDIYTDKLFMENFQQNCEMKALAEAKRLIRSARKDLILSHANIYSRRRDE